MYLILCAHPDLLVNSFYIQLHPTFLPDFMNVPLNVKVFTRRRSVGGFIEYRDKRAGVHVVVVVCSDLGHVGSSVCSAVTGKLPVNVHSYPVGHINNLCQSCFFFCFLRLKKVDMNIDDRKCAV